MMFYLMNVKWKGRSGRYGSYESTTHVCDSSIAVGYWYRLWALVQI
jgi:hypothetical protein